MHTTDTSSGMRGSDDAAEDRAHESAGGEAATEESVIDELRRQVDERQSAYLRALADFQNFQRRAGENELRAKDRGVAQVARALVPVLEQMDLALGHDLSALDSAKLAGAVDMIRRELLKALEGQGITRIQPKPGDEFDPRQHEAVMQQAAEGIEPGRIASCFQAGYRFGDAALRPAKVAVTPKES
ncbi:MAG: nucleotide exchange factor GrpE [Phycisphaerales bacterium]|nr:nucleotide exchange factor GrpE [Phycisphaerales bacterium]